MKVTNTAYVNMEVDFKSLSDQLLKQLQAKGDGFFYRISAFGEAFFLEVALNIHYYLIPT